MHLHRSYYIFSLVIVSSYASAKFSLDNIVSYVIPKKQEDIVNYEHKFDNDGSLKIVNTNGSINVKTWSQDHIIVEIIKKGNDKDIAEISFETYFTQECASITTNQPHKNKAEIQFNVIVPRKAAVTINTDDGNIKMHQVHNAISAETGNGSITINDSVNKVYARTHNGSITVKAQQLPDQDYIELENQDGDIMLHLSNKIKGNLNAKTDDGKITSDIEVTLNPRKTTLDAEFWDSIKKEVQGKIGAGGPDIKLATANGNIKILEY